MDAFLSFLKTNFIAELNTRFFPNMIAGECKEFLDEKEKQLSVHFVFKHARKSIPRVIFAVTMNTSNLLHIRINAVQEITDRFIHHMQQVFIEQAAIFQVDCFVSASTRAVRWKNQSNYETNLMPTGPLSASVLEAFRSLSSLNLYHNYHYFSLHARDLMFSSYLKVKLFPDHFEFHMYHLDSSSERIVDHVLKGKMELLAFENEISKKISFLSAIKKVLMDYTFSLCPNAYLADDNLYMFEEGVGLRLKVVKHDYLLTIYGENVVFTDPDLAINEGKKLIKKLYQTRRLAHLFQ